MNPVTIFIVPAGASPREFGAALHRRFARAQAGEPLPPPKPDRVTPTGGERLPLWTWFIANPGSAAKF